jgi:hypothetical protein
MSRYRTGHAAELAEPTPSTVNSLARVGRAAHVSGCGVLNTRCSIETHTARSRARNAPREFWSEAKTARRKTILAEGEGFEPPAPFPVQWFSRPPPSTTRPSLRGDIAPEFARLKRIEAALPRQCNRKCNERDEAAWAVRSGPAARQRRLTAFPERRISAIIGLPTDVNLPDTEAVTDRPMFRHRDLGVFEERCRLAGPDADSRQAGVHCGIDLAFASSAVQNASGAVRVGGRLRRRGIAGVVAVDARISCSPDG